MSYPYNKLLPTSSPAAKSPPESYRSHNERAMPQNEYIERWQSQHGKRFDHEERLRKRTARETHKVSKDSQNLTGLRAKLHQKKRRNEKIQMKKAIRAQEQKNVKSSGPSEPSSQPVPKYLVERSGENDAKTLSSAIKNKRNEKAAKFSVPLPKVKGISEEEMFKAVHTGKKTAKKSWKRMITKPTVYILPFPFPPAEISLLVSSKISIFSAKTITHSSLDPTSLVAP